MNHYYLAVMGLIVVLASGLSKSRGSFESMRVDAASLDYEDRWTWLRWDWPVAGLHGHLTHLRESSTGSP